jgi:uncharacterized membrane protein YfcA
MAKKFKKTPVKRSPDAKPVADEEELEEPEESAASELTPPVARSDASPLARSQERDLEIGLTLIGGALGALTGYGSVPFDAATGNVPAAVLAAVLGACCGFTMSRTLFLSVRAQWFVWILLAIFCGLGYTVGGFAGALVGSVIITLFVLFGLKPLARAAARAAERTPHQP